MSHPVGELGPCGKQTRQKPDVLPQRGSPDAMTGDKLENISARGPEG